MIPINTISKDANNLCLLILFIIFANNMVI